jgi:hypothetical protein
LPRASFRQTSPPLAWSPARPFALNPTALPAGRRTLSRHLEVDGTKRRRPCPIPLPPGGLGAGWEALGAPWRRPGHLNRRKSKTLAQKSVGIFPLDISHRIAWSLCIMYGHALRNRCLAGAWRYQLRAETNLPEISHAWSPPPLLPCQTQHRLQLSPKPSPPTITS